LLIDKLKYLQGYVRVRLFGYAPERFLNLCSNHNILIWNLEYREEQYEFCLSVRGLKRLKPILKKTRTRLVILERTGLPFVMNRYRKRKLFFAGIILCCGLLYTMSLFVWKIEVNGNLHETDSNIIKFLEEKQVYHGLLKSKINCEKIEEELRAAYGDIIWASAKLQGTMLIIDVQENLATNQQMQDSQNRDDTPSDLVADKEAEIYSILTRLGTPHVEKGMQVKQGDLLVEGRNPVMNDAGEVASYQYCVSDADILGITQYTYTDSFSLQYEYKNFSGKDSTAFGIRLFQGQLQFPHISQPAQSIYRSMKDSGSYSKKWASCHAHHKRKQHYRSCKLWQKQKQNCRCAATAMTDDKTQIISDFFIKPILLVPVQFHPSKK